MLGKSASARWSLAAAPWVRRWLTCLTKPASRCSAPTKPRNEVLGSALEMTVVAAISWPVESRTPQALSPRTSTRATAVPVRDRPHRTRLPRRRVHRPLRPSRRSAAPGHGRRPQTARPAGTSMSSRYPESVDRGWCRVRRQDRSHPAAADSGTAPAASRRHSCRRCAAIRAGRGARAAGCANRY